MTRGQTAQPSPLCIECGKKRNGCFRGNRCQKCYRVYAAQWALGEVGSGRGARFHTRRERTE